MYEIIMHTWYQETPHEHPEEPYGPYGFDSIEDAAKYMGLLADEICEYYPVEGLSIKYNTYSKLKPWPGEKNLTREDLILSDKEIEEFAFEWTDEETESWPEPEVPARLNVSYHDFEKFGKALLIYLRVKKLSGQ